MLFRDKQRTVAVCEGERVPVVFLRRQYTRTALVIEGDPAVMGDEGHGVGRGGGVHRVGGVADKHGAGGIVQRIPGDHLAADELAA